jgi:predicted nucleic acid-binding protein
MNDPIFVDTNVWVYAVDGADPAKRERALEATAPVRGRDLVISTQVLTEFYAVVTRKLAVPVSVDDAEAMVRQLAVLPVVAIDPSLVVSAIAGSREWKISIWDALILRAAEVAGCGRVLSEDLTDGATYGSVVVQNPFAIGRAGMSRPVSSGS